MNDDMKNAVTKLILAAAASARTGDTMQLVRAGDAMQFAQAALNAAHALRTLADIERMDKTK
jgi:uncharacterized cupin superfamily protein